VHLQVVELPPERPPDKEATPTETIALRESQK
jgi:hypothetical protein